VRLPGPRDQKGDKAKGGEKGLLGPSGKKGERGEKGELTPEIVSSKIDPANHRAIPFLSDGRPGPEFNLREFFRALPMFARPGRTGELITRLRSTPTMSFGRPFGTNIGRRSISSMHTCAFGKPMKEWIAACAPARSPAAGRARPPR
jgi:hypothetical protein